MKSLSDVYNNLTSSIRVEARFTTRFFGGLPASDEGLRGFIRYQMGIKDPEEIEKQVARIRLEESGVSVTPELGEIPEERVYGVTSLLRDEQGRVYIASRQLKANLEQCATRLGIFAKHKGQGIKGNFAEGGSVRGWGASLDAARPDHIYVVSPKTGFQNLMGSISTPMGKKSIIRTAEYIESGATFSYEFRFLPVTKLEESEIVNILALSQVVGLGAARGLEYGKMEITGYDVSLRVANIAAKEKTAKKTGKPNGHHLPQVNGFNSVALEQGAE